MAYTYDDNGNRRTEVETTDGEPTVSTHYNYDIDDPAAYGTMQNRRKRSVIYTVAYWSA
ncbi:MAG: hypothetical protein GY842_05960 [bacterium]|nr:hypothetical protein [bacterium]